jgi:hypothetical protein
MEWLFRIGAMKCATEEAGIQPGADQPGSPAVCGSEER